MSIIAAIQNYRGISSATLNISRIALVAGKNGGGKSSICQALAAALTGEPVPIQGVKKTSAGVFVRSGTSAGKITIEGETGTAEVSWPAAKVKTTGRPPAASLYATGLRSIVTMDDRERVAFLIDYLKANPTRERLQTGLAGMIDEGTMAKLWDLITAQGWDGAYLQVKEKGAKLKGQWEQVTNDNYGGKKAESWIPEGYDPALEGASEDTLKRCVTDASDTLEAAIASSAVDDSDRAKLQELADQWEQRKLALADARQPLPANLELNKIVADLGLARIAVADCQNELDAARRVLDSLPEPDKPAESYGCPHCQERVQIIHFSSPDKYDLVKWVPSNPEQAAVLQKAIDAQRERITGISARLINHTKTRDALESQHRELSSCDVTAHAEHLAAVREAERLVKECEDAQAELGKEIMQSPGKPVDDCRKDLAAAQLRLKAFVSKHEADRLHSSISLTQELLVKLAPTGVRAEVLTEALKGFNISLAALSNTAGWPKVQIEQDFTFTFGGSAYFLLSDSEKYRVRTIVQVAMAERERADMVVIDGADILDRGGRNGLFALLHVMNRPAVVGMTVNNADEVPKLAAAGYGVVYFIDDAVAREVC